MVSHIVPRDGSLYNKDIATLFPKSIVNDVVKANTARTNLLNKEVRAKAENYFTMNSNITATADLQKLKCLEHSFDAYKTLEVSSQNGVDIINTTKTIPAASLAAIRKNYTGVVNFAGHYSVVSWKCGVNCWEHAVVEGNQGKIVSYGIKSKFGVDAKIDSNLLVVNPYAKILSPPGQGITTEYFKLVESEQDGTASLVLVCSYNDKGITGAGATPITPQQIPTPDTVSSTTPVGEIPKRYVSRNKEECAVMLIKCRDDEQVFIDDVGCGCEAGGP
jgi:2C-methyl-D-erythritol 2,4-cyclodiphosphate synthase